MKAIVKAAAAIAMLAFTAPAFAGGVTVAEKDDSKLKLEGLFYLNTTSHKMTQTIGGVNATAKDVGLAVDRAYFTLKYYFNHDWMMRFTTDVNLDTGVAGKAQNVYLKYAYLEGKLAGDAVVLRLGQSHTPWIDYEQGMWGHRYVSKVMTDQMGYDDSSDLGVGLKGKLADGMLGYWFTETTGNGYDNKSKAGNNFGSTNGLDFNGRVGVYPVEGLTLDVQYRNGYRGTKTQKIVAGVTTITPGIKYTLVQVMATYGMAKTFRVGANYLQNKADTKGVAVPNVMKDNGYAVWAWVNFPGTDFGAFGRYEHDKAKLNGVANTKTVHYAGGVEYKPLKGVSFSLAYDQTKKTNIAGVAGDTSKDTRFGLYSQVAM